jgi:hypothetical protein
MRAGMAFSDQRAVAVTGPAKAETLPSTETLRSQYQRAWPVVRPVRSQGSAVGSAASLVAAARLF